MRRTRYDTIIRHVDHIIPRKGGKKEKGTFRQAYVHGGKNQKNQADLFRLDKALRNEAWLQRLKSSSKTSWSTVHEFVSANKTLISEADAKYTAAENLDDLVHLTWNEKEALSVLIEKHLKRFFKKRVRTKRLN